jgi:hypothetical protein
MNDIVKYVVYDSSGVIIKTGSCPEDHVALQPDQGHFVIIGDAHSAYDKVDVINKTVIKDGNPNVPEPYKKA